MIPLLILGLVAPGIADLGSKAGRLLVITAALAYAFTLFSGFGTFFTSFGILPRLLGGTEMSAPGETAATPLQPFFTVEMPPLMGVMTALILAFVLGLGMAYIHSDKLKGMRMISNSSSSASSRRSSSRCCPSTSSASSSR